MAITYEQVMNILSTDPLTGELLAKVQPVAKTFITRKELISACQSMNLNEVLFSASRRTSNHSGYAVEVALSQFVNTAFGQQYHATRNGAKQVKNPKWFQQLYTDLMWSTGDITPGAILQALAVVQKCAA